MTPDSGNSVGTHSFAPADAGNCIEVSVPARAEMWVLPRVAASSVGALQALDVERIEDLRMAVDELCTLCAGGAGEESVMRVVIRWDDTAIAISVLATELAEHEDLEEDSDLPPGFKMKDLSYRILEALVDEFDVSEAANGMRRGWLLKRS